MEQENIYERQHSCKWYFDESVEFYDELTGIGKREGVANLADLKEVLHKCGVTLNENDDNRAEVNLVGYVENPNAILNGSVFPFFLPKTDKNKKKQGEAIDPKKFFERMKFEVCKTLNTIDAIVTGLCGNNVDSHIVGAPVVGRETILKWLYTGQDGEEFGKQERDRATEFYRAMLTWYLYHEEEDPISAGEGPTKLSKQRRKEYQEAIDKVRIEFETDSLLNSFVARIRSSLKATIDQIHEAFQRLSGFRKYAIDADLATVDMLKKENLEKVLDLSRGILNFLLSVCASYMRIDHLQLPRADFNSARLGHANISDSNFASGNFKNANIVDGDARNCDFSMSTLEGIVASRADFTGALFSYSNLAGGRFDGAILSKTKLDSVALGKKTCAEILSLSSQIGYNKIPNSERPQEKEKTLFVAKDFLKNIAENRNERADLVFGERLKDSLASLQGVLDYQVNEGKKLSVCLDTYDQIREEAIQYNMKHRDKSVEVPARPIDLSGATIDDALIPNIDLSIVDLSAASACRSELFDAKMAYSKAAATNFREANLYGAFAYKSDFSNATFQRTSFGDATFVDCRMGATNFDGSTFIGTRFYGGSLEYFAIKDTQETLYGDLGEVGAPKVSEPKDVAHSGTKEYEGASLADASFKNINGTKAVFASIGLSRATFGGSLLRSAFFIDCDASSTIFDEADLTFSVHHGVMYTCSSFRGVSLQQAQLSFCDFTCCNFSRSKLLAADTANCVFRDGKFSRVTLSHSSFTNCVFRDCLFEDVLISNAVFHNCVFYQVDFTRFLELSRAKFDHCVFVDCKFAGMDLTPSSTREQGYNQHLIALGDLVLFHKSTEEIPSKYADYSTPDFLN